MELITSLLRAEDSVGKSLWNLYNLKYCAFETVMVMFTANRCEHICLLSLFDVNMAEIIVFDALGVWH